MKKKNCIIPAALLIMFLFSAACKNVTDSGNVPYVQLDEHGGGILTDNKMIIITTSEFKNTLKDFIDWKKEKGFDVELDVKSAGSGTAAVRAKLKDKYEKEGLTYIILVGDIEDVPSPYYRGYPSDPAYALLAGDDNTGDAMISRISVKNTEELKNQLNKILIYEKGLFENTEWITTAVMPQTTHFNGTEYANNIESEMKKHPENFSRIIKIMDDENDPPGKLIQSLEQYGAHMIVYNSHGDIDGFGCVRFKVTDVSSLTFPENCFPVIHGCGCLTGTFSYEGGDCLAEAALKTGTVSRPAGPVAMLAFCGSAQAPPAMVAQTELFTGMYYKEEFKTFGQLCYYSNLFSMKQISDGEAESHYKKCHLFGDCSMVVWKKPPQ